METLCTYWSEGSLQYTFNTKGVKKEKAICEGQSHTLIVNMLADCMLEWEY